MKLHDYGCTLKVMRKDIAKSLRLYGEMHRFIPAIADERGAQIAEIQVNHRPRLRGRSKYGISGTLRVVLDLLTVKFLSAIRPGRRTSSGPSESSAAASDLYLRVYLTIRKIRIRHGDRRPAAAVACRSC